MNFTPDYENEGTDEGVNAERHEKKEAASERIPDKHEREAEQASGIEMSDFQDNQREVESIIGSLSLQEDKVAQIESKARNRVKSTIEDAKKMELSELFDLAQELRSQFDGLQEDITRLEDQFPTQRISTEPYSYGDTEASEKLDITVEDPEDVRKLVKTQESIYSQVEDLFEKIIYTRESLDELIDITEQKRLAESPHESLKDVENKKSELSEKRYSLHERLDELRQKKSPIEKYSFGFLEDKEKKKKIADINEKLDTIYKKADKLRDITSRTITDPDTGESVELRISSFDSNTGFLKETLINNTKEVIRAKVTGYLKEQIEGLPGKEIIEAKENTVEEGDIKELKGELVRNLLNDRLVPPLKNHGLEINSNLKHEAFEAVNTYLDAVAGADKEIEEARQKKKLMRDLRKLVESADKDVADSLPPTFFEDFANHISLNIADRGSIQEKLLETTKKLPWLDAMEKNKILQHTADRIDPHFHESYVSADMSTEIKSGTATITQRQSMTEPAEYADYVADDIDYDLWREVIDTEAIKTIANRQNVDIDIVNRAIERRHFNESLKERDTNDYHLEQALDYRSRDFASVPALETWRQLTEAEEIPPRIRVKIAESQQRFRDNELQQMPDLEKTLVNNFVQSDSPEDYVDWLNSKEGKEFADALLQQIYTEADENKQEYIKHLLRESAFKPHHFPQFFKQQIVQDNEKVTELLRAKMRSYDETETLQWLLENEPGWLTRNEENIKHFMMGLCDYLAELPEGQKDHAIDFLLQDPNKTLQSSGEKQLYLLMEKLTEEQKKHFLNELTKESITEEPQSIDAVLSFIEDHVGIVTKETSQHIFSVISNAPNQALQFLRNRDHDKPAKLKTFARLHGKFPSVRADQAQKHVFRIGVRQDVRTFQTLYESEAFPFTQTQQEIMEIMNSISESPSSTMKNLGADLAEQIVRSVGSVHDMEEIRAEYEKVKKIFIENNLPFVGKQYEVFATLYPDERIEERLNKPADPSPVLESLTNNERRYVTFIDLLKGNFESFNRDIKRYLEIFDEGGDLLNKFESNEELSEKETDKLKGVLRKIRAMSENIRTPESFEQVDLDNFDLSTNIEALRENFQVPEDKTIMEEFADTFLHRAGFEDINKALQYYEKERDAITKRNRDTITDGKIPISENDLAKGVNLDYFDTQVDRGIYAPEFIGAETKEAHSTAESGDATPFDTDLRRMGSRSIGRLVEKSSGRGYGEMTLVVKDRGQFQETTETENPQYDPDKLELFKTGTDRWGIRTGLGSSQIDAIAVTNSLQEDGPRFDELKFLIARQGFYIPITNKEGEVIFDYDEYQEYRSAFDGVDAYLGGDIELSDDWRESNLSGRINQFEQTEDNMKMIERLRSGLYEDIEEALNKAGIEMTPNSNEDSMFGAEVMDTGSTGRGAALDVEDGIDFDFVVKLNDNDFDEHHKEVARQLVEKYPKDVDHWDDDHEMHQYRFLDFDHPETGHNVSLDIGFVKKSDRSKVATHEALEQKYQTIRKKHGKQAWLDVLTNIRFMKDQLKGADCYKDGIGGVGVETWVLQHEGDAHKALESFCNAAIGDGGETVPLDEFQNNYSIMSAGVNVRGDEIAEDFVYDLGREEYEQMVQMARELTGM